MSGPITPGEAQAIHDAAMATDLTHDRSSCWCCCGDCDFEFEEVVGPAGAQARDSGDDC